MYEAQELLDISHDDRPRVSRFFDDQLKELEQEVQEESTRSVPDRPAPVLPRRRPTAQPVRLHSYD